MCVLQKKTKNVHYAIHYIMVFLKFQIFITWKKSHKKTKEKERKEKKNYVLKNRSTLGSALYSLFTV